MKTNRKELDRLVEAVQKTKKGAEYGKYPKSMWTRYVLLTQKREN